MTVDFQTSLFDAVDAGAAPTVGRLAGSVLRHRLDRGAWVDVRPGWVRGADELFARLVRDVPWYAERRQMYDRVVDVPRLLRFYAAHEQLPDPLLTTARDALSRHYAPELGEPFTTAGMCYYRDGRDSVAWHGDTIGRSSTQDTMVAILSLGDTRRLSLRPRLGGRVGRLRPRPRRPARDGWVLPAHLGARRPQDLPRRRPADQHPVPPARRPLTHPDPGAHAAGPRPGRPGPCWWCWCGGLDKLDRPCAVVSTGSTDRRRIRSPCRPCRRRRPASRAPSPACRPRRPRW